MIIDIRTTEEYLKGHIPGAVSIPFMKLSSHPNYYLDKNKTYQIYCNSGNKSLKLVSTLNQQGYHCVNLDGGYTKYLFESFHL